MIMVKVSTAQLRDGDRVHIDGAVIKIEGKPMVSRRGPRDWFAWRNMTIVAGRLTGLPEATLWTVQGDTMCFWRVSR